METGGNWRAHDPVWSEASDPDFPDERALTGCACGDRRPTEMYGPAWMAEHLQGQGAPDYMLKYWTTWDHVEAPTGKIDRDAVARELFDFSFVMDQVSIVYNELADLSKPNYHAYAILGAINDRQEKHYREHFAERLCDRADDVGNADVRAELLRLAEEWSPGSWTEYQNHRAAVARLQSVKAGTPA